MFYIDLYFSSFLSVAIIKYVQFFLFATVAWLLLYVVFHKKVSHLNLAKRKQTAADFKREIFTSLKTLVLYTILHNFVVYFSKIGANKVYMNISEYGFLYLIFSSICLVVFQDTFFYWGHRLMHHPKLFKRFHLLHHKSINPTPFAAFCFNYTEAFVHSSYLVIVTFILPVHLYALIFWGIFMITYNVLGHSGYEILPSGTTKMKVTLTPTHHQLHHQRSKYNFALYFPWWDEFMKTEHPRYHEIFEENVKKQIISNDEDQHLDDDPKKAI